MRRSGRKNSEKRAVLLERGHARHAEGSCLVKFGDTHVLCTASVEERVPGFLKGRNTGWLTAEYAMLPRATTTRSARDGRTGRPSGRSLEIGRLIGRSLRAVTDLKALGERQITIDCDVLQADGGTRTAAITGGWMALFDAAEWMGARQMTLRPVLTDYLAAISCGIVDDAQMIDLDYEEDARAQMDANFVLSGSGAIVEIQASAEHAPVAPALFDELGRLARQGIAELIDLQKMATGQPDLPGAPRHTDQDSAPDPPADPPPGPK